MSVKPILSVTVTAYKRANMIDDLIKSFLLQSYKKTELIILDDCVEDTTVQETVLRHQKLDSRIRLIKNKKNLGYSKNFLQSLCVAQGKYIITLGDDDVFLHPDTIKKYVDVFESRPEVGYIYSNIAQFNNDFQVDYLFRHFSKNTLFKSAEESLQKTWLLSCYIPGIGLRNSYDFAALYPSEDMLFPQVELIGKIIGQCQTYGFGEFLIGGRAHQSQLGFAAIRGEKIKKDEKHSVYELRLIYTRLQEFFSKTLHKKLKLAPDFIDQFFETAHATILPNEKINAGNAKIVETFAQARRNNPKIIFNARFVFYFVLSYITPSKTLFWLKEKRKKSLLTKDWQTVQKLNNYLQGIHNK